MDKYFYKLIGGLLFTILVFLIWFVLIVNACDNKDLIKGRATVYSDEGITKIGTQTRIGMCATGNKELIGKQIVVYQRLPDDSKGEAIGIYTVEDTGCKENVVDLWYPKCLSNKVIDRTYENGCNGKVYIQIVEVLE